MVRARRPMAGIFDSLLAQLRREIECLVEENKRLKTGLVPERGIGVCAGLAGTLGCSQSPGAAPNHGALHAIEVYAETGLSAPSLFPTIAAPRPPDDVQSPQTSEPVMQFGDSNNFRDSVDEDRGGAWDSDGLRDPPPIISICRSRSGERFSRSGSTDCEMLNHASEMWIRSSYYESRRGSRSSKRSGRPPRDKGSVLSVERRGMFGASGLHKAWASRTEFGRPSRVSITSSHHSGFFWWCPRNLVLNPEHSTFLYWWDMVTTCGLAYVALLVPVQLSLVQESSSVDVFVVLGWFFDFVFYIDFLLQFFMMYSRWTIFGYVLEENHHKIVKHYLSTWCIVDFLSIFPFDYMASEAMGAMKVVRLVRLLKLARILRASRLFRRLEVRMSITYRSLALVKFFSILLLLIHWLTCLWCGTLMFVDAAEGKPRWIDTFETRDQNVRVKTKDSPFQIYVQAFYFVTYTITTVGYGDIGPLNIIETHAAIIILIVAGVSWAIILGQVCSILAMMNLEETEFRNTMDALNHMMRDRTVSPEMQHRLRSFFLSRRFWARRERHTALVDLMSPGLQGQVILEMNQVWLAQVPFLEKIMIEAASNSRQASFRYAFIVQVASSMHTAIYAETEVFGARHVLYILTTGSALGRRLVQLTGKVKDIMRHPGSVWGTDFMLADASLQHSPEVRALSFSEALVLRRGDFMEMVMSHSESCKGLNQHLRWYTNWLAFQRALMREARKRFILAGFVGRPQLWNNNYAEVLAPQLPPPLLPRARESRRSLPVRSRMSRVSCASSGSRFSAFGPTMSTSSRSFGSVLPGMSHG